MYGNIILIKGVLCSMCFALVGIFSYSSSKFASKKIQVSQISQQQQRKQHLLRNGKDK